MARARVVGKPLGERDAHRSAKKCNYEFLVLVSLWYSGPERYIILLQVSLMLNSTLKNKDKTKQKQKLGGYLCLTQHSMSISSVQMKSVVKSLNIWLSFLLSSRTFMVK